MQKRPPIVRIQQQTRMKQSTACSSWTASTRPRSTRRSRWAARSATTSTHSRTRIMCTRSTIQARSRWLPQVFWTEACRSSRTAATRVCVHTIRVPSPTGLWLWRAIRTGRIEATINMAILAFRIINLSFVRRRATGVNVPKITRRSIIRWAVPRRRRVWSGAQDPNRSPLFPKSKSMCSTTTPRRPTPTQIQHSPNQRVYIILTLTITIWVRQIWVCIRKTLRRMSRVFMRISSIMSWKASQTLVSRGN